MASLKRGIIFLSVITAMVFIVYHIGWSRFNTRDINTVPGTDLYLDEVATQWFQQNIEQYQQLWTPFSYRIKDASIQTLEILDEENGYIQLDYTITPFSLNKKIYENFPDGIVEGENLRIQTVLKFDETLQGYQMVEQMRPVNYQIQTDDDLQTEGYLEPEIDRSDEKDTYRIYDNHLYVTYDYGENYIEVPVDVDDVTYDPVSGNMGATNIQEGSYIVSEDYTGFLYVEEGLLKLIYSNDQGQNWQTAVVDDRDNLYLRVRYLSKTENNIYVLYSIDKTMSQEGHQLKVSQDGQNFEQVHYNDPETHMMTYALFISDDIGYVAYTRDRPDSSRGLYRTEDGGQTFIPIDFELEEVTVSNGYSYTPFIQVDEIYVENNQVHLILGQSSYGDYGRYVGHYVSDDGIHFSYLEQIDTTYDMAG